MKSWGYPKLACALLFASVACFLLPPTIISAWAQDTKRSVQFATSFAVMGAVAKPSYWTFEKLAKEFAAEVQSVDYVLKGSKGTAKCVPLLSLLKAAEPRLNPKVKNHLLAFVAFVRAEDGYTASFSLGELQKDIGKREVWIALERNGHPIPGDDGPVELIVTTDDKPARWVHGISLVFLVDGIEAVNKAIESGGLKQK